MGASAWPSPEVQASQWRNLIHGVWGGFRRKLGENRLILLANKPVAGFWVSAGLRAQVCVAWLKVLASLVTTEALRRARTGAL